MHTGLDQGGLLGEGVCSGKDAGAGGGDAQGSPWARSWQVLTLAILNHYVSCSPAACELCVELAPRGDASPPAWGGWP